MTRLQQTRRELLKSGAAMSAAVSFAQYGITPSWSAAGAKKDGLNIVDEVLRQAAETKEVPGVVAVAANSDGVIYEGAFGKRDLANGTDMTADSVFWIASMTKALTATAAMQLVEQGKLQLDEPISKVLPELAAPQVLEGFDDKGQPKLRPAKRPITLRQLLTHTAGFTYEARRRRYIDAGPAVRGSSRSRPLRQVRERGVQSAVVGLSVSKQSPRPLVERADAGLGRYVRPGSSASF